MITQSGLFLNIGNLFKSFNIVGLLVSDLGGFEELPKKPTKTVLDIAYNRFNNKNLSVMCSVLTLGTTEMEYNMNVIKSLENGEFVLKVTTKRTINQNRA